MRFIVVKYMTQGCFIGWDKLRRHGWDIDTRNRLMRWGGMLYKYNDNIHAYEECDEEEDIACDSGRLDDVLTKHRKGFGEPGRLPAADLPPITIDTEPGKIVAQQPYRAALA